MDCLSEQINEHSQKLQVNLDWAQNLQIPQELVRVIKIELFVKDKIHQRRTLIAELNWHDELVYFNYYGAVVMYTLSFDNGAAYTCSDTSKAGPG